jgi:hypothetical protein
MDKFVRKCTESLRTKVITITFSNNLFIPLKHVFNFFQFSQENWSNVPYNPAGSENYQKRRRTIDFLPVPCG